MNKTRIEWCDATFNPIIGCKNNCPYCYARKMNERFKMTNNFNAPQWIEKNFNKKFPKKPSRIFVNSMSDIYYWKKEWMDKTIQKISSHPQHTFLFLTKFPQIYDKWIFPKNCWFGVSITKKEEEEKIFRLTYTDFKNKIFVSLEPYLDYILPKYLINVDWVIIGCQTNPFIEINPATIDALKMICYDNKIPLFMKNSISKCYKGKLIQQFPEEVSNE